VLARIPSHRFRNRRGFGAGVHGNVKPARGASKGIKWSYFVICWHLDAGRAGADTCAVTRLTIPGLPFPLTASGRPPCQHRVQDDGALVLTGGAGTDLFVDPSGDAPVPDAGRLLGTPPDGDFTLAARVTVDFQSTYDAGVLLLHAGPRHWAKLCFEFSPQHEPTAVTVVTRKTSDDCNSFEVAARALWLRITRTGRAWAFHASTEGQYWRLLRYFSLGEHDGEAGAGRPVQVGFLAQSPTGQGCTVTFSEISLRAGAPSDLRDGS
jgi:regulation of enolase protein 1 (concanavalin A-like superfamily)